MIPLDLPGSFEDDQKRTEQLRADSVSGGYLIRSLSASLEASAPQGGGASWRILQPVVDLRWNSGIPFSIGDGPVWAGKGLTATGIGGVHARWGQLSLTLAPRVAYTQNGDFSSASAPVLAPNTFLPPWRSGRYSADVPIRFGNGSFSSLDLGESTLSLRAGRVVLGASTESQWWGPGIRNAIVMSDNAPGAPHLFLRLHTPLRTRVGEVEGKWLIGRLRESAYFGLAEEGDDRSLSAAVATIRPAAIPDLTIGVARAVYAAVSSGGAVASHSFDVWTRWSTEDSTETRVGGRSEQILSLFGRWRFPDDGVEVYGEWARHELPRSLRDLLVSPHHAQGYTLGLQWVTDVSEDAFRVQGEVTHLEQSATFRSRPTDSFYASRAIPQGYTNRGQIIGASIGPAGSSQWVAADYLSESWRVGLFAGRIRWDNDAYYTRTAPWPFLGHDVTVFGGVRGSVQLRALRVEAELGTGERMNFLFQNTATSWETSGVDAVDVQNHTLRLRVTPTPRRAPPAPAPQSDPPPPPAVDPLPTPEPLPTLDPPPV